MSAPHHAKRIGPHRALPVQSRPMHSAPIAMNVSRYGLHSARWLCRLLVVALALGCWTSAAAREDGELVLGRISDNPSAHYDQLKPMLDYVVQRMGDLGIRSGRIVMARDLATMNSFLRQGRVDWITETTGASITLIDRGHVEPLVLTWRGGEPVYRSVFVVRNDSEITGLRDLVGRTIAFQHPNSTSAYLVPAGMMLRDGLALAILPSPLESVVEPFTGYVFSNSETNSVAWVHQQLVDAAAISDQDYRRLVAPVSEHATRLRIIARSQEIPRGLELVHSGLRPELRQRLMQILLEAEHSEQGRQVMQWYFGTTRFAPVTRELDRQLDELRPLITEVRSQLQ